MVAGEIQRQVDSAGPEDFLDYGHAISCFVMVAVKTVERLLLWSSGFLSRCSLCIARQHLKSSREYSIGWKCVRQQKLRLRSVTDKWTLAGAALPGTNHRNS